MNSKATACLLSGKRFFIDPKVDKVLSEKVKEKLIALGGKVEEFLDKGVHFALTSKQVLGTNHKGKQPQHSPLQSPFSTTSPSVEYNANMTHRWKDLAKQASTKVQISNIVDVANSFGIKIRLIDDVLTWLNKKTENILSYNTTRGTSSKNPARQSLPSEIKLKDPCLKVEDFSMSTKPVYEEFDFFPHLDFSANGNKCAIVTSHVPKQSGQSKKNPVKKGFCESCQSTFLNERKHRKTADHVAFGENPSHFEEVDEYVSKEKLDMNTFLNRFTDGMENTPSALEENHPATKPSPPDQIAPANASVTARSNLTKLKTSASSVKSLPIRRSPRKLLKSAISHDSISNRAKSGDSLSATKKLHAAPNLENGMEAMEVVVTSLPVSNDVTLRNPTTTDRGPNCPENSILSDDNNPDNRVPGAASVVLGDSPLSRLRSFKRKLREAKKTPKATSKINRLAGESKLSSSSEADLLELLQSSANTPIKSSEFLGF